jgi:hypothetical protein
METKFSLEQTSKSQVEEQIGKLEFIKTKYFCSTKVIAKIKKIKTK